MNYDQFLDLSLHRRSIRKFKRDPVPQEHIIKILEAAHYAMSGGNSQPWEFMVIRDPAVKEKVFEAYKAHWDLMYYLEQQRVPRYRHLGYSAPLEEKEKAKVTVGGWQDAPVYIIVLEDGRKQYGSVLGARAEFASHPPEVLSTSIAFVCCCIHLAAASLGLGSQRVDIAIHEGFRQALKYPEPLRLNCVIPIGFPAYEPGPPHRFPLESMIHFDQYDMSKFLRNEDFLGYIDKIRELGGYKGAITQR